MAKGTKPNILCFFSDQLKCDRGGAKLVYTNHLGADFPLCETHLGELVGDDPRMQERVQTIEQWLYEELT